MGEGTTGPTLIAVSPKARHAFVIPLKLQVSTGSAYSLLSGNLLAHLATYTIKIPSLYYLSISIVVGQ